MPVPMPRTKEEMKKFFDRFMSDEGMMKDYPDEKQRYAMAMSQWKKGMKQNYCNKVTSNWETKQLQGKEHIVAPVVLLVEGVHNGLYYSPEELKKSAHLWNGVPLPVQHPVTFDGIPVSANSPEVESNNNVGRLYNVSYGDGKLKGEIWVDKNRLENFPDLKKYLSTNKPLEVSTGLFSDDESVENGNWNGEEYKGIVKNIKPDHLALLPGAVGACSWADGCGVRANSAEIAAKVRELKEYGLVVLEMSFDERAQAVRKALRSSIQTKNSYIYVVSLYSDYVIYEVDGADGMPFLFYKRSYTVDKTGEVLLGGDEIEVKEERSWIPVIKSNKCNLKENISMKKKVIDDLINNSLTKFKEEDRTWLNELELKQLEVMVPNSKEESKPCCPDRVANLIANKKSAWTTDDADFLNTLSSDQLNRLESSIEEGDAGNMTAEQYVNNAPEEMREVLASGLDLHRNQKNNFIATILANKNNVFTKQQLEEMTFRQLEGIASISQSESNPSYVGRGFQVKSNQGKEEETLILEVPTINWNEK